MSGISVQALHKNFGQVAALREVEFEVAEGELLSLLGPSGCGKTTTLRCIAGLERADAGVIRIGERMVSDFGEGFVMPPEQRGIGMVFQSYAIWPHMTVARNVGYPLAVLKRSKSEIEAAVLETLALVGMTEYASRPATDLSGGQQQRVALARALVAKPRVLLLDEPLSNLDAKLRDQMRIELRQIQQRLGVTAVYVTHNQSEAMALSDRIIVMNQGRIEQTGSPKDIYQRPATRFVAEFVGSTNFLRGRVTAREGDGMARIELSGGGSILVPMRDSAEGILVSLRPQFCQVLAHDAPVSSGQNHLTGSIERLTYFGERSEAGVTSNGNLLNVFLPLDTPFSVTDRVQIVFAPEHCVPVQE